MATSRATETGQAAQHLEWLTYFCRVIRFYFSWMDFYIGNTFRVDSDISLQVLLRFAARNTTARISAGMAKNSPKTGRIVNEITKKSKYIPKK
jgi:hypothetical protein